MKRMKGADGYDHAISPPCSPCLTKKYSTCTAQRAAHTVRAHACMRAGRTVRQTPEIFFSTIQGLDSKIPSAYPKFFFLSKKNKRTHKRYAARRANYHHLTHTMAEPKRKAPASSAAVSSTAAAVSDQGGDDVQFVGPIPARITDVLVSEGDFVTRGQFLLRWRFDGPVTSRVKTYLRSSNVGYITRLFVSAGAIINPRDALLRFRITCPHRTVMKGLCCDCGVDLLKRAENERLARTATDDLADSAGASLRKTMSASVSMVHHVPELLVSAEVAVELGFKDCKRLLKERKLALLIDLDQTLIHTSSQAIADPSFAKNEIHHFTLQRGDYHTKIRPQCDEFLRRMNELFELHICSFGNRLYAHHIARLIDPDEALFSHRIISRNELMDACSKKANMKSLFPCGDQMACIIDDRADVWHYSPNLVQVKPYVFFLNEGDVNSPAVKWAAGSGGAGSVVNGGGMHDAATPALMPDVDSDCYLPCLQAILEMLHEEWYRTYDRLNPTLEVESQNGVTQQHIPDLKSIMPLVRKRILRGCTIYVSHLLGKERNTFQYLASKLGAHIIEQDGDIDEATHFLSTKYGWDYPNQRINSSLADWPSRHAAQSCFFECHPEWLRECYVYWERRDELDYPIPSSLIAPSSAISTTSREPASEMLLDDDVASMLDEVDAELKVEASSKHRQRHNARGPRLRGRRRRAEKLAVASSSSKFTPVNDRRPALQFGGGAELRPDGEAEAQCYDAEDGGEDSAEVDYGDTFIDEGGDSEYRIETPEPAGTDDDDESTNDDDEEEEDEMSEEAIAGLDAKWGGFEIDIDTSQSTPSESGEDVEMADA